MLTENAIQRIGELTKILKIKSLLTSIQLFIKQSPPDNEIEYCISDLSNGTIPAKKIPGIPLLYIKEIRI